MKTVLITGGARGLGRAIALKFAENGYNIILTYLTSERECNDLKDDLEKKFRVKVDIYKLDLENESEVKVLFEKIDSLDVLINNAAYNLDQSIQDRTQDDFVKTLRINTVGPYLTSKYAYSLLKKTHGNIVNISSTNGIDSMYVESLDYDASKAALINLTESFSVAYSPDVRVNAVLPGWIETHKTEDMDPNFKRVEEEKTLLKRFAKPEEIANLVYFVGSEDASYMTGSIVRIDGGRKYGN